jgi:hypothetical protein
VNSVGCEVTEEVEMYNLEKLDEWVNERISENSKRNVIPFNILVEDADRIIDFARKHWEPTSELPGLKTAGLGLSEESISNIDFLKAALLYTDKEHASRLQMDLDKRRHFERAQQLLFELTVFLDWYAAATGEDEISEETARMEDEHSHSQMESPDELAHMLYEYASLAKELLEDVEEIGGLSMQSVNEAYELISRLVDISNSPAPVSEETRRMANLRNQLSALLERETERIRKATRFIFRDHPEIVKKVSSTYVDKKSAAAYRARKINKKFYDSLKLKVPMRFLPKY